MTNKSFPLKEETLETREYHSDSSGIFFTREKLIYRKKSALQLIEVIENKHFGKILLLDGLVQTTERDEFFYHEMLVHPALVTHPSPLDILIIGGGDGGGLKEVLRYPIEEVILVEIDPQVVEVSRRYFPWLQSSLEDKRTKLLITEGRDYIKKENKTFDIILVDSSDPVGPSLALHEEDFFRDLKGCLKPGGIVVAQVGSPFYHRESIAKKNSFLKRLYGVVRFYFAPTPTYPGGSWYFSFLSDEVEPSSIMRDPPSALKYFNRDVHKAAFSLPNFIRDILEED